jgi:hypothetical protein
VPLTIRVLSCTLLIGLLGAAGWAQQDDRKPQQSRKKQQTAQQGESKPPLAEEQIEKKPLKPEQQTDGKPAPVVKKPQQNDQQQMRGLDEEVQAIKSDVLGIAEELRQLEEKLLYPSGTQVALFVALSKGDPMRLDAVRLQVDGQLVAHHIYSAKELEALRKGGVQRIHVGNFATGDHQLEVSMYGKLASGADFSRTEQFQFRKDVRPKMVGLTLAAPDSGTAPIALGEW